ncbi:MAG: ABC transporter substrate-binding protein [Methanosarcinales archaeon]|nr:ABC transporter substrate-binding protein [Methanosarcinales archaeon]
MKKIIIIGLIIALMLLVLPAGASDYTLNIFGNANEDNIINMQDVTYTELIILEYKEPTQFADAKYDDNIDILDVTQIELVILGKEKELTICDQADRIVTVQKPVEKIVTLFPAVMRVIVHLDAADMIVGVCGRTADYADTMVVLQAHPELAELPCAGMYNDPNAEMIISLDPDVVFAYVSVPDAADTLQEITGIPVICISPSPTGNEYNAPGGPYDTWSLAGMVIGKREQANELISYCEEEIAKVTDITSGIPDEDKPTVYFCHAHQATDITRAVTSYDPMNIAGAKNVAGELTGSGPSVVLDVPKEQIIDWDPEIIMIHGFSKEPLLSIESVLSDPTLGGVKAIEDERIYYTKGWYIGWDPATGLAECSYMAKLFHPDSFADLDIEQKGNEILEKFYGVEGLYTWTLEYCGNYYTWN